MLALRGVLIVGVVLLMVRLGGATLGSPAKGTESPALSTLRRRYAAGELSREEYEPLRQVLER